MQGEYIRGLIKKIKQKPELNGVDDSVVKSALFLSLNKLKISKSEISSLKKSDLKMIIKQSTLNLQTNKLRRFSCFSAWIWLAKSGKTMR